MSLTGIIGVVRTVVFVVVVVRVVVLGVVLGVVRGVGLGVGPEVGLGGGAPPPLRFHGYSIASSPSSPNNLPSNDMNRSRNRSQYPRKPSLGSFVVYTGRPYGLVGWTRRSVGGDIG